LLKFRSRALMMPDDAPKLKVAKPTPTVVIIGHGSLAARGLKCIRSIGVEVPLVIADSADSGTDGWRLSFAKAARDLGYEDGKTLIQSNFPHSPASLAKLREVSPTLILSLQCQKIIRAPVREAAQLGVVNCHNAPLPLLRGCDPFAWAIHDGLKKMGVTLHQVPDDGIDSGPILCQALWSIEANSTAWDLYNQGLDEAETLIRDNIELILKGEINPRPQQEHLVTYHPMKQFAFLPLEMDWSLPAVTLSAFARARIFPEFQMPTFVLAGKKLHARKVHLAEDVQVKKGEEGIVKSLCPLTVAARWGALCMHAVRIDGEDDFVETNEEFGKRLGFQVGDRAS